MYVDGALGVQGCNLPAKRNHFTYNADGLIDEGFEVLSVDARGSFHDKIYRNIVCLRCESDKRSTLMFYLLMRFARLE